MNPSKSELETALIMLQFFCIWDFKDQNICQLCQLFCVDVKHILGSEKRLKLQIYPKIITHKY